MDIHYGNYLLHELYGIDMAEDKYEELALIAHDKIGNKLDRLFKYIAVPDKNGEITLPCNFERLEGVSTLWKDWEHVTNKEEDGDMQSLWIEQWAEARVKFKDPLYLPGKFVKYQKIGNKLIFDEFFGPVFILYRGEVLGEDGLPVDVSEAECDAIAAFIAYYQKYKEALKTMNQALFSAAAILKADWLLKCDQARVSHDWTQNDWNEVLDVKTSWDRHLYGKSYKMIH